MRQIILVCSALLCGTLLYSLFPETPSLAAGLGVLGVVAVLWLTEAIHITATALLVPLLASLTGVMSVTESLAGFASPIIFLFLGGFALAAALKQHSLDQWIALVVIRLSKGNVGVAVFLLFAVTSWTSMWISNTATTVMMLPIALGLMEKLDRDVHKGTFVFVLLGVAYSANIGGIGTLVGSPPNAIAASILGISFVEWMSIGVPVVVVLLPVAWLLLWVFLKPEFEARSTHLLTTELPHLHIWNRESKWVMAIFFTVVLMWLFSKPLSGWLGISSGFDALVAISAAVVLVGSGLLDWKQLEQDAEWGVLLLFGGGITLSRVLSETGASVYLADQLVVLLAGVPAVVFLMMAVALMIFLTEISSNTASSALFIPIFYSLPEAQIGLSPLLLSLSIAVAASCAFMLPVATPPNALVFGTGMIQQRQMMRVGLILNLVCIGVITALLPALV